MVPLHSNRDREERVCLAYISHYNLSSKEISVETQGLNLEVGTEAEAMSK